LPRRAAIESAVPPVSEEKFTALVQSAEIIYFPSELVGHPGRTESAWKLVEALNRDGVPFAIGWDALGGAEQPLLDQWTKEQIPAGDIISRLHLHGTAGENEVCRSFLREVTKPGVHVLALRCPNDPGEATSESALSTREKIPREFEPPPGGFERFKERFPSPRGTTEAKLRAAYDAAWRADECAAARIAEYFRENHNKKILAFVHRAQLGSNHGVPYLVARKIKVRQLVLDSRERPAPRSPLLAGGGFL
jgi:uncharacterized iron-regulated protein